MKGIFTKFFIQPKSKITAIAFLLILSTEFQTVSSVSPVIPAAKVLTVAVSSSSVCTSQTLTVTYTVDNTTPFNTDNNFEIILSNPAGTFLINTTKLLTVVGSQTGAARVVTIPADAEASTKYQIRVKSTSPDSNADSEPFSIGTGPRIFSITGGGNYCAGSAGSQIGLSGSGLNVSYQLFNGGTTPSGPALWGSGNPINFDFRNTQGTYTVAATNSCGTTPMNGSTSIAPINCSVQPPVITSDISDFSICSYEDKTLSISATGSNLTFKWQWKFVNTGEFADCNENSGIATYTGYNTAVLKISNANYGIPVILIRCIVGNGSSSVLSTEAAMTTLYGIYDVSNVTGGGIICQGGFGVNVGLDIANLSYTYTLLRDGIPTTATLTYSEGTETFGPQTVPGIYTVLASNASCSKLMNGSATVTLSPNSPAITSDLSDFSICTSEAKTVSVSATGTGLTYQWQWKIPGFDSFQDCTENGSTVIYKGAQTAVLTISNAYTGMEPTQIRCLVGNGSCEVPSKVVTMTTNTGPYFKMNVTGGGTICQGGDGAEVGLDGTESGVIYTLMRNGTATNATLTNINNAWTFGKQTQEGNYTVVATVNGGCPVNMNGSATITFLPAPVITSGPSGVTACSFQPLTFSVQATGTGLTYQWLLRSSSGTTWVDLGTAVSNLNGFGVILNVQGLGTPTLIITGNTTYFTAANALRCVVSGSSGCSTTSDIAVITIQDGPTYQYNVTGGGTDCIGGPGVVVGLDNSESGITYKLLKNGSATGISVPGTGSPVSFGNQTSPGTYTVVAEKGSCSLSMNGSAAVTINSSTYPVITSNPVSTSACVIQNQSSQASFSVTATGSGLTYKWQLGSISKNSWVDLSDYINYFNQQISQNYITAQGMNTANLSITSMVPFDGESALRCLVTNSAGCSTASSTASLSLNIGPQMMETLGGGGKICPDTGGSVGLVSSEAGVTYQLWKDGSYSGINVLSTGTTILFGQTTINGANVITDPGTYTAVAVKNGCTLNMSGTAVVSVYPDIPSVEITGNTVPCSGTFVTYTATEIEDAQYGWTLPSGWSINGYPSTNSISVIAGTGTGNVTVTITRCEPITVSIPVAAQNCMQTTYTSSTNFTVPAGVTYLDVKAWGGGGSGGSSALNSRGGGGGGAYASSTLSVTPGATYSISIGSGGQATKNSSSAGGSTIFGNNLVVAAGGSAGADNDGTGGAGGAYNGSTGYKIHAGGSGGDGSPTGLFGGGGGGGSAFTYGNGGNGGNGSDGAGGAGGSGTGNGGKGGVGGSLIGSDGSAPGGGGGGNAYTGSSSGSGAPGQLILTYTTACNPPVITAHPSTSAQTICPGGSSAPVSVTATGDGITYQWYSNTSASNTGGTIVSGATASTYSPPTGTSGSLYYYCILKKSCSTSVTSNVSGLIKVNSVVVPALSGTTALCMNSSATYTTESGKSSYIWTVNGGTITSGGGTGNNTATVKWTASGTQSLTVSYKDVAGCTGTSSNYSVSVNPLPTVTVISASLDICSGSATSAALSGSVTGTTFAWTVSQTGISGGTAGNGTSINQILSNSGTTPATAVYTITPTANSCSGPTAAFTVTVNPTPDVTPTPSTNLICSESTTSIYLGSNVTGTAFSWTAVQNGVSGASAATGTRIEQKLTATGNTMGTVTYTITPSTNGCIGTPVNTEVDVVPPPTVPLVGNLTVCNGASVSYISLDYTGSLSDAVSGKSLSWTCATDVGFGTSGSRDIGSFTAINTGNAPVTATVTAIAKTFGCQGPPMIFTVTVKPSPNVTPVPPTQSICSGTSASANLSSLVSGSSFAWTVVQNGVSGASAGSGTSISQVISVVPPSPSDILGGQAPAAGTAVYTITPTANGCAGPTATFTVSVKPLPTITNNPFTGAVPVFTQTICSGSPIVPSNLTGPVAGTTFTWTRDNTATVTGIAASGTGNVSGTLNHTQSTPVNVTFTVTPWANGCAGVPVYSVVTVNPMTTTTNPASATIKVLEGTSFSVTPSGTAPFTYQWQVDPSSGFANITNVSGLYSGATSGTLVLTNVPLSMNGYKYRCIVAGGCGVSYTTTAASLTVVPRPTALVFSGDLNEQYSDQACLKATLTDITGTTPVPIPNKTVTFTIGSQSASDTYVSSTGGGTDAAGIAEANIVLTQKPATTKVVSSFAGDAVYAAAADSDPFAILCENATVTYNGASYFGASPTTKAGLVTFGATVTDAADSYMGNITNATVTFLDGGLTGTVIGTANRPVGLTGTVTTQGSASTSLAYTLTSADIATGGKFWEVWTTVNNYYCGQAEQGSIVTLGMPGSDNVTGGGNILMTNTYGQYPGLNNAGRKMNFGLVMKWNKNAKNMQGKVNIIYRGTDGYNYQIKSNSLTSLIVSAVDNSGTTVKSNAAFNMATIVTKATLTRLLPTGSTSLGGNLTLTVIAWESLTDKTGKADRISVQLSGTSGTGVWFSSNWSGSKTSWQTLTGGKIQAFDTKATISHMTMGGTSAGSYNPYSDTTFIEKSDYGIKVFPNPFADNVNFDLRLEMASKVRLEIYSILGNRLETIFDQHINANESYRIGYTPVNVSSGMLTYRLVIDNRIVLTGKMIHK